MAITNYPIIILAAGASRRMQGRDKLLEDVDGAPLLRQQAIKARAATKGPVIVALPPLPHPRYQALHGLEVLSLPIGKAVEGMNASLREAFAALPPNTPCAMLLLADLPDLTAADLRSVADAVDLDSGIKVWRGATDDMRPGHPIVFHAELFKLFANLAGDGGGREVVAAAGDKVMLIPLEGQRARRDLDTSQDWDAWRKDRAET